MTELWRQLRALWYFRRTVRRHGNRLSIYDAWRIWRDAPAMILLLSVGTDWGRP